MLFVLTKSFNISESLERTYVKRILQISETNSVTLFLLIYVIYQANAPKVFTLSLYKKGKKKDMKENAAKGKEGVSYLRKYQLRIYAAYCSEQACKIHDRHTQRLRSSALTK